ncbi:MAG: hypothetical protein A2729_03695 [Candidatus Buchananbacteria bacterium RIFCSPHIGHO2_01_FULL_39_14]|uniref:Uncharacterized protein n=1 Tax=Candidatus Buchananbacteria bacterium RIFCSPHIGHO2_01_FULL_39_14 TaxID=1797532 RepID=A0A1G1XVG0_9BACT|nr:MAG: hypothetical protein A2729_03695 [Candidatus Buchananbacteria bacterium RIFCSPHIGHO2_01_FULL_39_14]
MPSVNISQEEKSQPTKLLPKRSTATAPKPSAKLSNLTRTLPLFLAIVSSTAMAPSAVFMAKQQEQKFNTKFNYYNKKEFP